MSGQVDSWAPKPGPMQDFNRTWWQWEDNFEMMLENEWSCTFFEMFLEDNPRLSKDHSNGVCKPK